MLGRMEPLATHRFAGALGGGWWMGWICASRAQALGMPLSCQPGARARQKALAALPLSLFSPSCWFLTRCLSWPAAPAQEGVWLVTSQQSWWL